MSLLVVGSVALDTVETPTGRADEALGGSAVYFSLAASYFTRVMMVGAVGHDFPPEHKELLEERGIDTSGLVSLDGRTFRWTGRYAENMIDRETLDVQLNVFDGYRPELPEAFRAAKHVFLANASPEIQMHVLEQIESPEFVASDTMNIYIENELEALRRLMERVDCFVLNDEEAFMLTGERSLVNAARAILDMGPATTIIKKGAHGSVMASPEDVFLLPAYPLGREIDPTGAGDSFAGAFCGTVANLGIDFASLRRAVAYATVTASFCVEGFSVDGFRELTRSDIDERYEEFMGMTHVERVVG